MTKAHHTLLTVSGGADSVAMVALFKEAGFSFGIAHVNFKLRAAAADGDEHFVRQLAKECGVPYYVKIFDTKRLVTESKDSLQMVARDLRYTWFEEIRQQEGYDFIATAHHLNDSIETLLLNLTKGTGIAGLHGISPKTDRLIRPLLFASRADLLALLQEKQLTHRDDASNADNKYQRNFIRNLIVPQLREINPALEATFAQNIQNFKQTEAIFHWAIQQLRETVTEWKNQHLYIVIEELEKTPAPATLLFEILRDFGFNKNQVQQIRTSKQSGAQFLTDSHELYRDRSHWIVLPISTKELPVLFIEKEQTLVDLPEGKLLLEVLEKEDCPILPHPNVAYLDLSKVIYPLTLRRWQQGDSFQPFGMGGKSKLLSDLFIDKHLSIPEKEAIWILDSNGTICWVVGLRSDERFRITKETRQVLRLRFNF